MKKKLKAPRDAYEALARSGDDTKTIFVMTNSGALTRKVFKDPHTGKWACKYKSELTFDDAHRFERLSCFTSYREFKLETVLKRMKRYDRRRKNKIVMVREFGKTNYLWPRSPRGVK